MSKTNKKVKVKELFPENDFSETVFDTKIRIAVMYSVEDPSNIKLIYKQKVLKNDSTIESYSPNPEDEFFVYISNKSSTSPSPTSSASIELSPSGSTELNKDTPPASTSEPTPSPASSVESPTPSSIQQPPLPSVNTPEIQQTPPENPNPAPNPEQGYQPSQESINQVVESGFTEEQAKNALSITNGDANQAINLLLDQGVAATPTPKSEGDSSNNATNDTNQASEADLNNEEDFTSTFNYTNVPGYGAITDQPTESQPTITSDTSFAPPPTQNYPNGPYDQFSFAPRATPAAGGSQSFISSQLKSFSAPQPISSSITQVAPPEVRSVPEIMHNMMGKNQMGLSSMSTPNTLSMFHGLHGNEMESFINEQNFGSQPISPSSPNYGSMSPSVKSPFSSNSGLSGPSFGFTGSSGFQMRPAGSFQQPNYNPQVQQQQQQQLQEILSQFNDQERAEVIDFVKQNPSMAPEEVIGIYVAAEKNIEAARAILHQ